ncbi:hypothetical protein E8E13_003213 [Curvularia kusanoi]|uniref:Uncharacterized protein n=1 Tax=Curvularia kusanoi TaxID=90978 RepID=A0A9P4T5Q7_CURKU|nr:hypothetical protein E8E13_003213 [Curvularia kusanoi]
MAEGPGPDFVPFLFVWSTAIEAASPAKKLKLMELAYKGANYHYWEPYAILIRYVQLFQLLYQYALLTVCRSDEHNTTIKNDAKWEPDAEGRYGDEFKEIRDSGIWPEDPDDYNIIDGGTVNVASWKEPRPAGCPVN